MNKLKMNLVIRTLKNVKSFTTMNTNTNIDKVLFIGRWSIPHSKNIHIDQIVDRNNEDHCGVCVPYEKDINEKKIDDNYYIAFTM